MGRKAPPRLRSIIRGVTGMWHGGICLSAALLTIAAMPIPQWAFPGMGSAASTPPPDGKLVMRLPGSPRVFLLSDIHNMARAIDWFPDAHPPAPEVVLSARGNGVLPCGYCHLADGRGRPENASLRGLPADYIVEQVRAFASGVRRAASPDFAPSRYMANVAHAVTPADLTAAATYFSQFEHQSHTRIVEQVSIPAAGAWSFVYRFDPVRQEVLGEHIVEGPVDRERFELRDPGTSYIAYVPKGAIARGGDTAARGASGGPACMSCHGAALAGIAGASPSYVARQLMGFRSKSRNDLSAAPMQAVAAGLSDAQIIDVATYVGSRRPWTQADVPKE